MKKSFIAILILTLGIWLVPIAGAQIYLSGPLSGTLSAGEYIVVDSIRVNAGSVLNIAPGAHLRFAGHYKFNIYGWLNAVGTQQDTILFTRLDSSLTWWGIRFYASASDSSILRYCRIEYGNANGTNQDYNGGGIFMTLASVRVEHCLIQNNLAVNGGGGIYCVNSNPLIRDCVITHNEVTGTGLPCGGGIFSNYTSPRIINCVITDNSAPGGGGGIYIAYEHGDSVIVDSCIISGNVTYNGAIRVYDSPIILSHSQIIGNLPGGGIDLYCPDGALIQDCIIAQNQKIDGFGGAGVRMDWCNGVIVEGCQIRNNVATLTQSEYGGGGCLFQSSTSIEFRHCLFEENISDQSGGGIRAVNYYTEDIRFINCTFSGNSSPIGGTISDVSGGVYLLNSIIANTGVGVAVAGTANTQINYCDFHGNAGGNSSGLSPNFGQLMQMNVNGDSCDTYHNLFLDPQFVDTAAANFHLLATSPCIDAGDPTSPLDPDNTIADMGVYYFHQGSLVYAQLAPLNPPIIVPATGGSFAFYADLFNLDSVQTSVDAWTTITAPSGSQFPVLTRPGMFLSPQSQYNKLLTQNVPATASPGTYWYHLYLRNHLTWAAVDHDSFSFQKAYGSTYVGGNDGWYLTGWDEETISEPPASFALYVASPNPFNPSTAIRYKIQDARQVSLRIYDTAGRLVATLVDGWREAGTHEVTFDGSKLASGLYFVRMEAGEFSAVQKIVLMK